ncbi:hypothetical protein TWF970_008772 [Orbilia oligospora]|uniref:SGNH hydrolase-type esterase domain-containing protein n=1 Tax=Orbilia oligospora TaxID=2813651 RepID=A0A7C8VLK6_ORBOL|nr:hypothetical protein TWF970_008772 [Orbilia oligospora]
MHLSALVGLFSITLTANTPTAVKTPAAAITQNPAAKPSTFVTPIAPTSAPFPATFTRSMPTIPTPSGPPVRYWFSFGDSYTNTNFSVNGVQPSIENPFGNPEGVDDRRRYNGTYIPYITTKFNSSITFNYNLARIGMPLNSHDIKIYHHHAPSFLKSKIANCKDDTGASLNYTYENTTSRRSFQGQFNLYTSKYASLPFEEKPWQQNVDTIYSSWFGINDVKSIFASGGNSTDPRIDELITSQFSLLDQLYFDVDAKAFLVINLPPLETAPLFASDTSRVQGIVRSWNSNLARKVRQFRDEHSVSSILLIDSYNIIRKLQEEPKYGVKNGVWADKLHIKTQVHKVLAKEIAAALEAAVETTVETPGNGTVGGPTTFTAPTPTMEHGSSATSGTLW